MSTAKKTYALLALLLIATVNYGQIGIGTTTPDPTSILDIESTTQGFLAPRMTTAQRTAIASPANGLFVFDTDQNAFYFYDLPNTRWLKSTTEANIRSNYKIVKSATDLAPELAAGGGTRYLLTSNYLYEINGTIILAAPIELNNAYVIGLDTNGDILARPGGVLFTGSTGGSVRGLTLTAPGGTVFQLSGSATENLIVRDSFIANSASVGSVSGFGLVFTSILQYVNNSAGVTYSNIGELLLSNEGWEDSNSGTYQTFTGSFDFIQKVGGFSNVLAGRTGLNIAGVTSIAGDAVLKDVVFYGGGTYVNGTSTYSGYNFDTNWVVDAPGIPFEQDDAATGNIYITTPIETTFTAIGVAGRKKIAGTTAATEMFRTSSPLSNRIRYDGARTRAFTIQASFSIDVVGSNKFFTFYIAKNGTVIEASAIRTKVVGGGDIRALSFTGTVSLSTNDYIEVWAQNDTDTGNLIVPTLNLLIN